MINQNNHSFGLFLFLCTLTFIAVIVYLKAVQLSLFIPEHLPLAVPKNVTVANHELLPKVFTKHKERELLLADKPIIDEKGAVSFNHVYKVWPFS